MTEYLDLGGGGRVTTKGKTASFGRSSNVTHSVGPSEVGTQGREETYFNNATKQRNVRPWPPPQPPVIPSFLPPLFVAAN